MWKRLIVIAVILTISSACVSGELVEVQTTQLKIGLPKPLQTGTPWHRGFLKNYNIDPMEKSPRRPFLVPAGADKLLSAGKRVTGSDTNPVIGTLAQITDGDKEGMDGSWMELGSGKQWVQIDLGATCSVSAVVMWHQFGAPWVYRDVVVQVTDDSMFQTNVFTIFNNDNNNTLGLGFGKDFEYIESYEGKLVDALGIWARYVRFYSNGSSVSEMNRYIEVEVYGRKREGADVGPVQRLVGESETELRLKLPRKYSVE